MEAVERQAVRPVDYDGAERATLAAARRSPRDIVLVIGSLVVVLAAWQLAYAAGLMPKVILPSPIDVATAFVDLVTASYFPEHALTTTAEAFLGFFVGSGLGFLLAMVMTYVETFRKIVYPYVVVLQVVPKVALAPLFITWFGLGIESKVVTAATITFFPVVINTMLGLMSADPDAVQLMRSLRASRRQIFWKLDLPSALPAVFAGLATAATISLIGAIVAEFVTARRGLGLLLVTFNSQLRIDMVFAIVVVISLIGLAMFAAVLFVERRVVYWRTDEPRDPGGGG